MTTAAAPATFPCPRCGHLLIPGQLVCPQCNGLVYAQRLNELATEAMREEPTSPIRAAIVWQQTLPLLPPDSDQYRMVAQRIGALTAGLNPNWANPTPDQPAVPTAPPKSDPLPLALAKTIGSMLLSIAVYTWLFSENGLRFGAEFATGFVILILIHELGHVIAMKYYGLSASPPIFIPFLGALINLRQPPRNALEEAVVGIGGPVTGTLASFAAFAIAMHTHNSLFLELAYFGFLLNLFNMLPVPPLDGGRVTAAVSPWIWVSGLIVAVLWILYDFLTGHSVSFILILLLFYAWPRIKRELIDRKPMGTYYQIGWRARTAMGFAYVILGVTLAAMYALCKYQLGMM